MALVDNAVYVDGRRTADLRSLEETYELLRDRHGMAWIGLDRPDAAEIRSVATASRDQNRPHYTNWSRPIL
jgi:magnesium transporter